jgi:hypothetical protein
MREQLSNHKKTAHMLLAKHPALLGMLDDLSANMTLLVNEQETLEVSLIATNHLSCRGHLQREKNQFAGGS